MTTFHTPLNGVSTTVAAARAVGAGTIAVADGTRFGPGFPLIATAVRSGAVLCIFEVTGVSGNTLTVSGAIEGTTDTALLVGDTIEMRPTALAITEIQAAVLAIEAAESGFAPIASPSFTGTATFAAGAGSADVAIEANAGAGTGVQGNATTGSAGQFITTGGGTAVGAVQGGSLTATSTNAAFFFGRAATLNGFDMTSPVLYVADSTTASGPLLELDKGGVGRFAVDGSGDVYAAGNLNALGGLAGTPTAPTPPAGDSSTKIATTAFVQSALPTATNAQVIMTSSYILNESATWLDTGLAIALPAAGTYLLAGNVRGIIVVSGSGGQLVVRLYDTAAAAEVSNSERFVTVNIPGDGGQHQLETGYTWLYTATAATTISLQARRVDTDSTTAWAYCGISSDSNGYCALGYIKLS